MYNLFYPIYSSNEIIITYGLHPFDICTKNPELWNLIKIIFIFTFIVSNIVISNFIFVRIIYKILNKFFVKNHSKKIVKEKLHSPKTSDLSLIIGRTQDDKLVSVSESGLYQNFLITGTIGSGKTSSAMYPFLEWPEPCPLFPHEECRCAPLSISPDLYAGLPS